MTQSTRNTTDANRDPITGAAGSHPVGTGVGAVLGGAAAGAATGTVAGPVGTVIGAAVGAVVGGLAGKGIAESIDPTREDAYWRENYASRPYVSGASYNDFGPAYAYGVSSYRSYAGRTFEDVESDLSRDWTKARGKSSLQWERAKHATRDAWHRVSDAVERAVPGDSDRDGK
ncbi:MAG: glycine zipper domain-containing protein [Caldimonas sp.]